jgi:hypothetical protein
MVETMTPRRFAAPWTAEKIASGYVETSNIVLRDRGSDRRCNEIWLTAQPKHHAAVRAELRREAGLSNRSTKRPERKREQSKRWFRNSQKWRTGCEGHISVIKRWDGLNRCQDAFGGSVGRRAFGRRNCL